MMLTWNEDKNKSSINIWTFEIEQNIHNYDKNRWIILGINSFRYLILIHYEHYRELQK